MGTRRSCLWHAPPPFFFSFFFPIAVASPRLWRDCMCANSANNKVQLRGNNRQKNGPFLPSLSSVSEPVQRLTAQSTYIGLKQGQTTPGRRGKEAKRSSSVLCHTAPPVARDRRLRGGGRSLFVACLRCSRVPDSLLCGFHFSRWQRRLAPVERSSSSIISSSRPGHCLYDRYMYTTSIRNGLAADSSTPLPPPPPHERFWYGHAAGAQ